MGIEKGIGEEDGRIRAVVGRAGGALLHETVLHQRVRRQAAERPGAEAVARISALGGLAEVRIERALQQRRAKAKQPALDRHFRDAQDGLRLLEQRCHRLTFTGPSPAPLLGFDGDGGQLHHDIGQCGAVAALTRLELHRWRLKALETDPENAYAIGTGGRREQHELPRCVRQRASAFVSG